ncbi:hypothetical protein V1514DRAFT_320414 [Lipomyces japonicus]|uniref:uncharacterized protein n=1 Tax=Lipomyces japonicus TaxID=56871 RepID=UPI0034CED9EF
MGETFTAMGKFYNLTDSCVQEPSCFGFEFMWCDDGYFGPFNSTVVNQTSAPCNFVNWNRGAVSWDNSSSSKFKVPKILLMLACLAFLPLTLARNISVNVLSVATLSDGFELNVTKHSSFLELFERKELSAGYYFIEDVSALYVIDTAESNQESDLVKRQDDPWFFTDYEISDHGTWWSPWKMKTGCNWAELSDGPLIRECHLPKHGIMPHQEALEYLF